MAVRTPKIPARNTLLNSSLDGMDVKRRITARQNSKLNPIIYSRFLHITAKFSAASSHYSRELSVQL